jgi:hypothetical protein
MFEASSHVSAAALPADNYVQPNVWHGLRIWWAFFWPTNLISGFLIIVLDAWLRRLYEDLVLPARLAGPMLKLGPYVLSITIAFFGMYYILHKNFRHFRIGLLSNRGGAGAQLLNATLGRTLRVWWTYTRHVLIYYAIGWVVATLPLSAFVGLFSPPPRVSIPFSLLLSVIVGGFAGLYAIYSDILDEDIGDFRVCVLPLQPVTSSPPTPAATTVIN